MASRYTSRLITVKFQDADSPVNEIVAGPGPGDLTIGDTNAENAERIRVLDRGQFDGFVLGDDLEQEVSITLGIKNEELTHGTDARIRDFVMKTGSFASNVSTDPTIYAIKVLVTLDDGATSTTMTLPVVQGSVNFTEAKEGATMVFSGTNNGAIVVA
tara:strand:- start:704 stop:1177 length:474 start_codon:yes stop_codon:yes gene_type:complete